MGNYLGVLIIIFCVITIPFIILVTIMDIQFMRSHAMIKELVEQDEHLESFRII